MSSIELLANKEYKYGFVTDIESDVIPKGLTEDTLRLISEKKNEPDWMLEFRLKAYRHWLTMKEPKHWPNISYPSVDYQDIIYYSAPKQKAAKASLDEVDPELLRTFEKLGIPLQEQKHLAGVAVDAVFDSVSVATTYKEKLKKHGVIFCSFSEAVQEHPELIRKYLGSVVPVNDNYFAALNSAVFTDGSFVFVPKGVRCPMELSTYFRINNSESGQFERTLVIAEEGAYVSYLEGCHPAGEQVLTATGWRNIESIKAGDAVYDHEGRLRKVRAAMVRRHKGEMITVRPVSRYNEFKLTPEHPVLVVKRRDVLAKRGPRKEGWLPEVSTAKLLGAQPRWVKADELERGDFLLVPKLQRPDSSAFADAELELLGYYLAEGSTYFNKANKQFTNQFSRGLHETDLINRVRSLINEVTGRPAYLTPEPDRNGAGIAFYSAEYSDWFARHCGKGAATKTLSPDLMSLSPRQTRVLLDAYLAGDGNVCERGNSKMVRFCTASETLAQQVQMLLNKLDVQAWIQVREGGEGKFSNASDRRVTRRPLYQVGYTAEKKWDMVRETETHFLVPVREVGREKFDDLVFNIDVAETHSYLVRGFAVHNCTAPKFDKNQLHAAVVELVALDDAEIKYSTGSSMRAACSQPCA
ncbi:MAG: LAGLIDADG family homing endonuclease, partial [Pyrinomonadaceae bacterium]